MKIKKSYIPNFKCNAQTMLVALSKTMNAEQKRVWASGLDIHEPVSALYRYSLKEEYSSLKGIVDSIPTISWLIRYGDRDFIEGALSGPPEKFKDIYIDSRDTNHDSIERCIIKEALGMADVETLNKVNELWNDKNTHNIDRVIHLTNCYSEYGYSESPSGLTCLARHADAHSQEKVNACVDWLLNQNDKVFENIYIVSEKESAKAKSKRLKTINELKAKARSNLLKIACDNGSVSVSNYLLEMNTAVSWPHITAAFENGAVDLALKLWKMMLEKNTDTSSISWSNHELGEFARKVDPSKDKEVIAFNIILKVYRSIKNLMMESTENKKVFKRELDFYLENKESINEFLFFAISKDSLRAESLNDDALKSVRTVLAGEILANGALYDHSSSVIAHIRKLYPLPSVEEIFLLAKTNQTDLLNIRMKDANKAKPSSEWKNFLAKSLVKSMEENVKYWEKEQKKEGADNWVFRLLAKCENEIKFENKGPIRMLKDKGLCSGVFFAEIEACLVELSTHSGEVDNKKTLRL